MDKTQRDLLRRRLRVAVGQQPDLKILRTLLLRIGGTELVAPIRFDPDVQLLMDSGFDMSGPVKCRIMRRSACHENIARLWKAKHRGLVGVGTGYALSDDGLWRQHSWGIRRDGILETTLTRARYFGIRLQGADADSFAACNFVA